MARRGKMSDFVGRFPMVIVEILRHQCSEARYARMVSVLEHRIDSISLGL